MPMRFTPFIFVLLWATGFIAAKWGLPYAEPFTFLAVRMALVVPLFMAMVVILKRQRLTWLQRRDQMLVGLGTHGIYLGGVFHAIDNQMPAGVAALIVGTQPLLTALIGQTFLGKRLSLNQWLGIGLGLVGIAVVLLQGGKLSGTITALNITGALAALVAISLGTLWQSQRGGQTDLVSGSLWQFTAALVLFVVAAAAFEDFQIQWTLPFIGAWLWSVIVLSVIAALLWLYMLRHGEAARVTQYMYLSPPTTAIMAAFLFAEPLTAQTGIGTVLVVAGLYLARPRSLRKPAATASTRGTT